MESVDLTTVSGYVTTVQGFYDIIIPLIVSVAGVTVAIRVFKKISRAN